MSKEGELVEFQEATSVKVGRFLVSKELVLANNVGVADDGPLVESNSLGILYTDPETKPQKYLGFIPKKSKRIFLGTLWFKNEQLSATQENWFFETYGNKYAEFVRELTEEIASTFKIKITLYLKQEEPKVEAYQTADNSY